MAEKRIALMSYDRLTELVLRVVDPELLKGVDIYNASFFEALGIVSQLIQRQKVDVVVSGGGNYRFLKENVSSVPILDIEISGYDVLEAVEKGLKFSDSLAILCYKRTIPWMDSYSKLFKGKIIYASYDEEPELEEKLKGLKEVGCGCVIGTSLVCNKAEEAGLKSIFVYSRASVVSALRQAVEMQESLHREQERSQQLSVILDVISSGIVAINREGKITLYNPAAANLAKIPPAQAIGKNVQDIIPNTRLKNVVDSGREEKNQFQTMPNGSIILTNRVPIKVSDRVIGAVATFNTTEEISQAERHIRLGSHKKGLIAKHTFENIVGSSWQTQEARKLAELYALEDSTVLITGETGTGKELFAQSIHNRSHRRNEPFVPINCAALPEDLLESELFGHEEGAFTGARKGGKMGLLELGHRGTVFLDEIGQMSQKVQSRLLRVLEEKEIMRVGSSRVIPIDIRVVAASNRSLVDEVAQGNFRDDLFYRLNVLHIELPPLRERKEELQELLATLAASEGKLELYEEKKELFHMALSSLADYSWPGNIREFRNVIKRLCVVFENNLSLDFAFRDILASDMVKAPQDDDELKKALANAGGNKSKAAKMLGISRTTLWRRANKAK